MTEHTTVTAVWSGFNGAPGYSRFNFLTALSGLGVQAAGNQVKAFFEGVKGFLRTDWTIQVQPIVQIFDDATGALIDEKALDTPLNPTVGTVASGTQYAGGTGGVVQWTTGAIWNGRKVRGRTFLIPAIGVYQVDGTLGTSSIAAAQAAAAALINQPNATFGIYARKFEDQGGKPVQTAGLIAAVNGSIVPDRAALMRSRR